MNKKIITLVFLLAFFYVSIIFIAWEYPINSGIIENNNNFTKKSHHPRNIIDIEETKETLKTSNPGPQLNYSSFQMMTIILVTVKEMPTEILMRERQLNCA